MARFNPLACRRLARGCRGTAAVEFVMVLPVLLVLILGAIEIGRVLRDFHVIGKGVRDATRYLTRVEAVSCTAAGLEAGAIDASEAARARNLAMAGTTEAPAAGTYRLAYWSDPTTIQIAADCLDKDGLSGLYRNAALIPRVRMTASVPVPLFFGALVIDGGFVTVTARHKELYVGL